MTTDFNHHISRLFFRHSVVTFALLIFLFFKKPALANDNSPLESFRLRTGDILLIELNCFSCTQISLSTGSPFSHSGLVLTAADSETPGDWSTLQVAQSLSKVETVTLKQFLAQAKRPSKFIVRRPNELAELTSQSLRVREQAMVEHFNANFVGQPFDSQYLWDNYDNTGRELLYCSELIQKTLNHILDAKLEPEAMHFGEPGDAQWQFWQRYFNGPIPQGLPGNSPAFFHRAAEFTTVYEGELLLE